VSPGESDRCIGGGKKNPLGGGMIQNNSFIVIRRKHNFLRGNAYLAWIFGQGEKTGSHFRWGRRCCNITKRRLTSVGAIWVTANMAWLIWLKGKGGWGAREAGHSEKKKRKQRFKRTREGPREKGGV